MSYDAGKIVPGIILKVPYYETFSSLKDNCFKTNFLNYNFVIVHYYLKW